MAEDRETAAERAARQFHEAKDALHEFLTDAAMRAIKSELRASDQNKLVIQGLGAQKKFKRYYDAEFLANALPADQADLVLHEKVIYEVDREQLEQLSRQGEIDNEIVTAAYHEEEGNPANLPGTPKPYAVPSIPVDG